MLHPSVPRPLARPLAAPLLAAPLLARLREAWAEARRARDLRHEPLRVAAGALAVYARAQGLPVAAVLHEVDAAAACADDTDASWSDTRAWASASAIASYYRDD